MTISHEASPAGPGRVDVAEARARISHVFDATKAQGATGRLGSPGRDLPLLPPGSTVSPPIPITWMEPGRSVAAELTGEAGHLVVECVVDEAGMVRDCLVLQSWPEFEPFALRAIAQWRFRPALVDGVPRAALVTWAWKHEKKQARGGWRPHWKFRWDRAMVSYEW